MPIPFIGLILSAGTIVFLVSLFRFERSRDVRLLGDFRAWLDDIVSVTGERSLRLLSYLESGVFRQSTHFLFHTILRSLAGTLAFLQQHLDRLIRSNKAMAQKARKERSVRNTLDDLQEHKEATAMSEAEKRRHRAETLEG